MRYVTPTVWDPTKTHLKYVVSYDKAGQRFFVDIVANWQYHGDCHVPTGFRRVSAGYFSVPKTEYQNNDVTNAETWGGSEGFQIGPHSRDLSMLKGFVVDGTNTYDEAGNALDSAT